MKRNSGLIISIVGVLLIAAALIIYLSGNNGKSLNNKENKNTENTENNNKENNENVENTENTEKTDKNKIDNDLSGSDLSVLSNIPRVENNKLENSKYVFQDKKVSIEDIEASDLYSSVIYKLSINNVVKCKEEDCDIKISLDDVKNEIKKMYGDVNKTIPNNITENSLVKCTLNNNMYFCKYVGSNKEEENAYKKYFYATKDHINIERTNSVEKDDKNMYIYERFINLRLQSFDSFDYNNLDSYKFKLYKNTNTNDLITNDVLLGKDYYKENDDKVFQLKVIDKYIQSGQLYKHTFILDSDNTYKWVSTEPVE